jgi:hypothetical protein
MLESGDTQFCVPQVSMGMTSDDEEHQVTQPSNTTIGALTNRSIHLATVLETHFFSQAMMMPKAGISIAHWVNCVP